MSFANIKVAVISDLHVGAMAKGKDFCPFQTDNASVDNYLDEFVSFVGRESIVADYLLVTGDISDRASADEFALAERRIEAIARAIGVDRKRILFCPGNHDMDWGAAKATKEAGQSDELQIKAKMGNLLSKGSLFLENMGYARGRLDEEPYLSIWGFDDLNVISLNSAVYESSDTKPHHGEVRDGQLSGIEGKLNSAVDSNKVNIFIVHHHPKQYHDKGWTKPDFSCMTNAEGLMGVLSKYEVDFIVHGHKHVPRFTLNLNEQGHPVWVLCAGSFSSRLDDRLFGAMGNYFHVIEFHGRNPQNNWMRGVVRSWAHYLANGWISGEHAGFDSHNQFGALIDRKTLHDSLHNAISDLAGKKSVVCWADISDAHPDVNYYPNSMLEEKIRNIAKLNGLLVYYKERVKRFENIVLVKGGST